MDERGVWGHPETDTPVTVGRPPSIHSHGWSGPDRVSSTGHVSSPSPEDPFFGHVQPLTLPGWLLRRRKTSRVQVSGSAGRRSRVTLDNMHSPIPGSPLSLEQDGCLSSSTPSLWRRVSHYVLTRDVTHTGESFVSVFVASTSHRTQSFTSTHVPEGLPGHPQRLTDSLPRPSDFCPLRVPLDSPLSLLTRPQSLRTHTHSRGSVQEGEDWREGTERYEGLGMCLTGYPRHYRLQNEGYR